MHDKKLIITAQFFISAMMAFLMTGLFGYIRLGLTDLWLSEWLRSFAVAWPVAFCLAMITGPLGFKLAGFVHRFRTPSSEAN